MSDYWKPLSPTSIAILCRLRTEIQDIQQRLDLNSNRADYSTDAKIQILGKDQWRLPSQNVAEVDPKAPSTKPA